MRNPTVDGPEEVLREVEGGERARLFGSGMGAIAATVVSLARAGDEIVAPAELYGGTTDLLREVASRFGVTVKELTPEECRDPGRAMSPRTRLAIVESPTNPLLHVVDLAAWARASHAVGAVLAVDNTFATPVNQRPLSLGADLVLHSATKYLGGHSDLTAGAVVGAAGLVDRIDPNHLLGAPLDPFSAFLLQRSLKTLVLRVERQSENARRLVAALRGHPAVARVHYPGLASPHEEELAGRQMRGRGGVFSLSLRGGEPAVTRFFAHLDLVHVAPSFGGVESLTSAPRQTSHVHLTPEELALRGIDEGMVRISVGIEDVEDLEVEIRTALDAVVSGSP